MNLQIAKIGILLSILCQLLGMAEWLTEANRHVLQGASLLCLLAALWLMRKKKRKQKRRSKASPETQALLARAEGSAEAEG
ncbi:hypothetical protein [Brevibacillus fulvus]|uniref:Membrane protein YfcA n=1 Tax=Brevibacillus fulvus TaxID=1125967 RepID=A0A938XVM6_9BACL|nr:hypothetical protein [Brevibacillus fulvus]MBM7588791.1 putative membrane protein YfcA [Brevibacillus fulvus]